MAETLLDYVTSLQNQGIDGNSKPSIYELVEKWKKENPDTNTDDNQPEEVEETEVVVDENADNTKADNPNNPFAERAQQYEDAENQQKAYEEYKKQVESVAKPEETYSGHDGDLEYKYTLENNQPTYYQRKKGSNDEWTTVNQQEDQDTWYDIGAKVFKHLPYDETAADEAQSLLNSSRGFNNRINLYKQQGAEVDDDEIDIDPEEAAFVEKIYKENVYVTDDQQIEIDDKVNVFMDIDPNIDFSKYGGQTYVDDVTGEEVKTGDIEEKEIVKDLKEQFKGSGIKINEAVGGEDFVKVELPNGETKEFRLNDNVDLGKPVANQRKELQAYLDQSYKSIYEGYKNKAIAEVAEAQGLTPDQLDVNANANAINNKIAALRTDDLKAEQRTENLENYIEELGTEFSFKGAKNYLANKLGPTIFSKAFESTGDITNVFQKTETQKRIEQYEEIKKSNIDKRSKKIELFLAGGSDLLKDLNKQAIAISQGNYQTPAQVTEANKQLAAIKQQSADVQNLLEQEYDKYTEYIKGNKDNQAFLNKLSRNYGTIPIIVNNIKASAVDMGLGVTELGSQAFELFEAVGDEIDEATGVKGTAATIAKTNPLGGVFSAFASVMPEFEDEAGNKISFKDKAFDIANAYTEDLRSDVAEAKSVGDIKDFGDFSTWLATTTGSLIPQVTAMVVAPYTGLALVTASAGGSKFMEYEGKMEASEEAYLQALGLSKGATEEEIKKAKDKYIADGGDPNDLPEPVNYSTMEMWGGAMLNMGLEATTGRFISLPLAKGKSILGPLFKRTAAIGNPATRNTFNEVFKNTLKKGAVHIGDATLEGAEEGFIGIGDKWYQRNVLGEDVNIFEGFYDNFSAGFVGGGYFKAPGIISSYLTPVQTPGDVSNITGLQNEIKSINNSIIENPKMSAKTREILENNVADKTAQINNSINNSLNIYTEISEGDFNTLGNIDQQLTNLTKQINAVSADPGITTGKEQLIEDLTNARNELTGQKNQLLEPYMKKDLEGQMSGGNLVAPIIKFEQGADVVAEQLGTGIQRFETDQDFLGGIETLREEGVNIDLQTNEQGEILPASDQNYGLIATLEDGTKQIIINNASNQADGLVPADAHELIHMAAAKMDPAKKVEMGESLLDYVNSSTVTKNDRIQRTLDTYKKDLDQGKINEATYYEEVMAVVNDGLLNNEITINEPSGILAIGNKILETIGWKQNFDDGKNVIKFLQDFNQDIIKGEGLSQEVLDTVESTAQPVTDTNVVQSKKLPEATQAYMDLDNSMLQQGLNEALQNKTDQQFPLAQAIVEKNWPLISKSLNINNQQEMDAAKEVVVDQVLGQFEGSGQGKYGPRNTSALAGFDLEGGAQVSTYLAETIRTRKPEIDAAIVDRTGGPGVQADQLGDIAVETETTEVETTRPLPSETTKYSDAILETVNTDKAGLETRITEAVQESYPGRTDVRLAETRNIPQKVAEIYTEMLGITNPNRLTDKSQTFSVTDEAGLRNAQMFLTQNAQADFANLPDALDADGKGTFIPLNVKRALYTDGKKTGTLKDYLDLIKIPSTKKIYRDSAKVGTIRGLLGLHIRNRILETGNPDAASRKQSGAKFSKKVPAKPKPKQKPSEKIFKKIIASDVKAIDGVTSIIDNIDPTFNKLSQKDKIKKYDKLLKALADAGISRSDLFAARNLNAAGARLNSLKKRQGTSGFLYATSIAAIDNSIQTKKDLLKKIPKNAVTAQIGDGKKIYTREGLQSDINQLEATKRAIQNGEVGLKSDLLKDIADNRKTANKNISRAVKPQKTSSSKAVVDATIKENIADINQIKKGIKDLLDIARGLPKDLQGPFLRMFHGDSNYNQNMGRQIGAILGDMGIFPLDSNGKKLKITNEHALQFGAYTRLIGATLNAPKQKFETVRDWLSNNIFQVALADIPGRPNQETKFPEGTKGIFDPTETKEAWDAKSQMEPFLRDKIQDFLDNKITKADLNKISSLTRYFNEYFYRNPNNVRVYNSKTKKVEPVSKVYNTEVPSSVVVDGKRYSKKELMEVDSQGLAKFPNVEKAQAYATMKRVRGEWTAKKAKDYLKVEIPIALAFDVATVKTAEYMPSIIKPNKTVDQLMTTLKNSLKTRVLASKKTPKTKGISIFDFDDTLALTKEKVIVNMPDGSVKEISASEFARTADQLTEDGATFDFSNFDKVAKGTAEGPLADLARKRQGKFGSGDIFVLTARPNSAGPAIQQFLKSIGINIPLSNITGLSDGSPQAKVDFVLNKTAEGYNDFYFADDSFANVKAVSQILDAIDVKNKVDQAQTKEVRLNNEFNKQIEEVTGKESFKRYSDTRAKLEGKKKDGGLIKRFIRQFTITPSADDFMGLLYAMAGKGEQGNKHLKFLKDNLIDPYNKAELELLTAKVNVAKDFAALRSKFPSLKGSTISLTNPLLKEIDNGPFNKEQAVRVYLWNKQGLEIPGMSKRDVNKLVKAVEADIELQTFADELASIQRGPEYPPPGKNWLGGSIKTDILESMDGSFRSDLMSEFNENVDIIFSPENLNKVEAIYGSKYRQALEDSIRRMKSGNNRPKLTGSGSGLVNEMLDWLNASVANVMFLNMRSGLLQTLSTVNFINWGDNNIVNASKAFASKEMWPTFMRLMNSDYLVNRRDGLKINVNEAELADAAKKGGIKGAFSYLLDKGFAITRVMDSFAIALGGSTFFINRKKALLNRVNEKTGKLYTEAEADTQAFEDFYAVAEETQQSSNPSKISSQQASIAGRLLLSFQNVTMQFNRKTKKSIQDLYNRRKKPGMTQRESDMSNLSSVVYYVGMQNLMFNALQQGIFALMFDDEEEEEKLDLKKQEKLARTLNGMADSLLFGLGFGGAIVATSKNILKRIADENTKKKPDYRDIPDDVFDVSSVIDAKYRKLKTAAKTFTFNRKEIKRRGWSLDNPAYLAVAQIISAVTNAPVDRVLQKVNNLRQASDESVRMWQRVALVMGWNGWNFDLPYWGRQSTIDREKKEDEKLKENYAKQVKEVKAKGFTKKIPLSGPNHYKPKGKLGVDYMQVERPDGTIQYYVKHKK